MFTVKGGIACITPFVASSVWRNLISFEIVLHRDFLEMKYS